MADSTKQLYDTMAMTSHAAPAALLWQRAAWGGGADGGLRVQATRLPLPAATQSVVDMAPSVRMMPVGQSTGYQLETGNSLDSRGAVGTAEYWLPSGPACYYPLSGFVPMWQVCVRADPVVRGPRRFTTPSRSSTSDPIHGPAMGGTVPVRRAREVGGEHDRGGSDAVRAAKRLRRDSSSTGADSKPSRCDDSKQAVTEAARKLNDSVSGSVAHKTKSDALALTQRTAHTMSQRCLDGVNGDTGIRRARASTDIGWVQCTMCKAWHVVPAEQRDGSLEEQFRGSWECRMAWWNTELASRGCVSAQAGAGLTAAISARHPVEVAQRTAANCPVPSPSKLEVTARKSQGLREKPRRITRRQIFERFIVSQLRPERARPWADTYRRTVRSDVETMRRYADVFVALLADDGCVPASTFGAPDGEYETRASTTRFLSTFRNVLTIRFCDDTVEPAASVLRRLQGKFVCPDDVDYVISEDCDVFDNRGNLILRYRKGVLPTSLTRQACIKLESCQRQVPLSTKRKYAAGPVDSSTLAAACPQHTVARRSTNEALVVNKSGHGEPTSNPSWSAVAGFSSGQYSNRHRISPTAFTRRHPDTWRDVSLLVDKMDELFKRLMPAEHAKQRDAVTRAREGMEHCLVGSSVFSTAQINRNFQTSCHVDRGDWDDGWSCMTTLREGTYTGGYYTVPRWRIAVDIQEGDLVIVQSHRTLHGNTPIVCDSTPGGKLGARWSIVAYLKKAVLREKAAIDRIAKRRAAEVAKVDPEPATSQAPNPSLVAEPTKPGVSRPLSTSTTSRAAGNPVVG